MAIYDVNAAIQKPNIVNAMQQGFVFGSQQRQVREQREREEKINALAPQVIGGDPQAYAQAAAVDPQRAQEYQQAGDVNLRKMKGAVEFINRARQSGNPQAVNAALRAAKPYLSQYANGAVIPDEWTPEMEQGWPGFEAKVAMLGSEQKGALSARAAGFEQLTQGLTPEQRQAALMRELGLEARAVAPGYSIQEVPNADGTTSFLQIPTRGAAPGQAIPVGVGAPQPMSPQAANSEPVSPVGSGEPISFGVDDPTLNALPEPIRLQAGRLAAMGVPFFVQNGQVIVGASTGMEQPQAAPAAPQGQPPAPVGGGQGFGQTDAQRAAAKAQEAAMVEQAKIRAGLELAPQQAEADAAREAAVTSARSGAANQAKRDAVQTTNNTAFAQYTAARDTLLADLKGTMTGPVAGRLPAVTESQQIAEGAQARMAPILKGLFRTAGEGTFTDKDQELLMAMVPTRTDLPGAVEAKIAGIDAIIQAKLQQKPAQDSGSADAAPVEGARKAPDGNWYVQRDGRYFKVEP